MIDFIALLLLALPALALVTVVVALAIVFVEKTNRMVKDDYNEKY